MDTLDIDEIDKPHERWVDYGKVGFLVRYASPHETDLFAARLAKEGVGTGGRNGSVQPTEGHEKEFYRAFAQHYIRDWRGNIVIKGEKVRYSSDEMARILSGHGGIFRAIMRAINDADAFFGDGGNASTVN